MEFNLHWITLVTTGLVLVHIAGQVQAQDVTSSTTTSTTSTTSTTTTTPAPPDPDQLLYSILCLDETEEDNEIFLQCGGDSSIYIRQAVHGHQPMAQDSQPCGVVHDNPCTINSPELEDMMDRCMGQPQCNTPVKHVFIDTCSQTSNYVQVEYQCIPERYSEAVNIVDVCGDILEGSPLIKSSGYIETPNYPEIYPPDVSCSCNLTTLQPLANLSITLLDLDLQVAADKDACHWDWIEFLGLGEVWGAGGKRCQLAYTPTTYSTSNNFLQINFKSDSQIEKRGFWLKYQGLRVNGDPADVELRCSQYTPMIMKEDIHCIPSDRPGLELDCSDLGVIDILSARHGYRQDPSQPCEYSIMNTCGQDMTRDADMMERCMGQTRCDVPASQIYLPNCKTDSDYFQVRYQCIPETNDVGNIMDVCGARVQSQSVSRRSGYIESSEYPHNYPPNLNCQCNLITDETASVHLEVMDMFMVDESCDGDWLKYSVSDQKYTEAPTKLCNNTAGDILDTSSSDVLLTFHSDSDYGQRGFWIKYFGVRRDGSQVPVSVTCKTLKSLPDYLTPENTAGTPINSTPSPAIIIALAVLGILILLLVIGMVVYKIRKSSLKTTKMTGPVMGPVPQVSTPLDKSYSNLKQYASLSHDQQPYSTLDNSPSASSSLRGHSNSQAYTDYVEKNPDYDKEPATGNLPSSYVNNAYNGSTQQATAVFTTSHTSRPYDVQI